MARSKRPVEDKHQSSESDHESDSSASDLPNPTNHLQQNSSDPAKPKSDSFSDSDSESDSDTDSDSNHPSNFTIKPIQSKQQPSPSSPAKPSKAASKRASEAEAELGLKELKRAKVEDDDVKKGSQIQRLFSEEDEVALLEGIIEFQAKKGVDVSSDINRFHEFVRKSIHFEPSANQLKEKIRRLKGKFHSLVRKSGEEPVITKAHDLKVFNLSKRLWGSGSVAAEKAKKSVKMKDGGDDASKGEEGVVAKKQKSGTNGGGSKKKELIPVRGESGGGESEGDDAEEEYQMVVDEKGGGEEDIFVKYPLCVNGLMEVNGFSDNLRCFYVRNLGLILKEKLEHCEVKLEKIMRAKLELFIQERELINEMLRLLLDVTKSRQ